MEAIKQALQAMALELLREVGYKAEVVIEDGPQKGLLYVHFSRDRHHLIASVRAHDSFAETDNFLRRKVWEFKAYLSTKEEKPAPPERNSPIWRYQR